jgi:hypothetical protein
VAIDEVAEETDVSGATAVAERKLERLIQRVEGGESEGIVNPYLDRFGRDLIEGALAYSAAVRLPRLPQRGCRDHPDPVSGAERWVGTVRRDCLDWLLIARRRQLELVLRVYVDHYKRHRPNRALELTAPTPARRLRLASSQPPGQIHRRDRLGGLIHEYARAA